MSVYMLHVDLGGEMVYGFNTELYTYIPNQKKHDTDHVVCRHVGGDFDATLYQMYVEADTFEQAIAKAKKLTFAYCEEVEKANLELKERIGEAEYEKIKNWF